MHWIIASVAIVFMMVGIDSVTKRNRHLDGSGITAEAARRNQGDHADDIKSRRISGQLEIINDSIERRSKESLKWDVFFVDKDIASDVVKSLTDRGFEVTTKTNPGSPFKFMLEVGW